MKGFDLIKNGGWKAPFQSAGVAIMAARPELALIGGGILLLVGTLTACTKTEKAKKAAEEAKEAIKKVDETLTISEDIEEVDILPETRKQLKIEKGRQYTKIYGKLAYEMFKIYGIPAFLWISGFSLVTWGHIDLRHKNRQLAADMFAGSQLMKEYRERVAKAVGKETEQKIFMGVQEGTVKVLEKDPETGEKKLVEKKADIFYANPGSIFARNYVPETTDIMYKDFDQEYAEKRARLINYDLESGLVRCYTGIEIFRKMGFNEDALGLTEEELDALRNYGISTNARKVPDPNMRRLNLTFLDGYRKVIDAVTKEPVFEKCVRLDFNFYPLEGKV